MSTMAALPNITNATAVNEWLDACTLHTCPLEYAQIQYDPSLGGNVFYLVLFLAALIVQLYFGITSRTWSYLSCMICGLILEVAGYGGRIGLHNNPFIYNSFLV